jgi:hypothetical protein
MNEAHAVDQRLSDECCAVARPSALGALINRGSLMNYEPIRTGAAADLSRQIINIIWL